MDIWASQVANPLANVGDTSDMGSIPGVVFFPGKSHGQTSQEGYSPWVHKKLDKTTELLSTWIFKLLRLSSNTGQNACFVLL